MSCLQEFEWLKAGDDSMLTIFVKFQVYVLKYLEIFVIFSVRAFFWLLLAVICCIFIAIILGSKKFDLEQDFVLGQRIDFVPKPKISSLMAYKFNDPKSVEKMKSQVDKFLQPYKKFQSSPWNIECDYSHPTLKVNESCTVHSTSFGRCNEEFGYGYDQASPCVFIKFNKIANWTPSFFTLDELETSGLSQTYIHNLKNYLVDKSPAYLKTIWVECQGRQRDDRFLLGNVNYSLFRGFPYYYFPYKTNQFTYLEPVVAIQFQHPRSEST